MAFLITVRSWFRRVILAKTASSQQLAVEDGIELANPQPPQSPAGSRPAGLPWYLRFIQRYLRIFCILFSIFLLGAVIALAILYSSTRKRPKTPTGTTTLNITTISVSAPSKQPDDFSYITTIGMTKPAFEPAISTSEPDSELAYISGKQICIRTK